LAKAISAGTLDKISQRKTLTDEEKTALKPKVDEFSKTISKSLQDIIMKNFDIRNASNESLQKNYEKIFTLAELQKLNTFFKSANGKRFVRRFKEMTNDKLEGKESKITDADMKMFEQISKVISLKTFSKFTDILIPDAMEDIQLFVKNWSETAKDSLDKDLENQNLKAQIEQFIAENSK
jgi:lipopolysaccharide biosynthesis regulator YciM